MRNTVTFVLDNKIVNYGFPGTDSFTPTTTVLNYLRSQPDHKGVKEGCAEGDCGACTVVLGELDGGTRIRYRAVDSCLIFLPMLHGKQLITVEDLRSPTGALHPVQQEMVDSFGSQCGFCTPGIIMSMFALYKNHQQPTREQIDDALTGNLCRCTGYQPIVEAAVRSCAQKCIDHFTEDESRISDLLRSIPHESLHLHTEHQRYFKPRSLGEAVSLKHQHQDALILNGATDIALRITKGHELIPKIIDLSDIDEMKEIRDTDVSVSIGAGVSLNDITVIAEQHFPALYELLKLFASQQIRNLATLGGNLGTASPVGDTIPLLMAYHAKVIVESLNGRREIDVNDFIRGYRTTALKSDELITSVIIPKTSNGAIIKFYKSSKRRDMDISTVSAGFRLVMKKNTIDEIVLAYGGMADRTKRAVTAERFLVGKRWERGTVEDAMKMIHNDFKPISDVRGSAEFRTVLAKNLLLKFWSET